MIGDGGFVFALEKRGYVKAGPWTPEANVEYPEAGGCKTGVSCEGEVGCAEGKALTVNTHPCEHLFQSRVIGLLASRETGPPCCYLSASWSLTLILGQSGGGSVPCLSLPTLLSPLGDLQVLPFLVFISKELASLCAFSYPSLTCHQQSRYL